MKSILSSVCIFAAGAAIGSVVTWKLLKTKYEQLAKEEIESVKEVFSRLNDPENDKDESTDEPSDEEDSEKSHKPTELDAYVDIIRNEGYSMDQKGGSGPMKHDRPYVIEPEEFGEGDYETVTLSYYTDGILADDMMYVIENVDDVVGDDFAEHFGEYEDDSVHIRNDVTQTDYEILLEARAYSDVMINTPNRSVSK